MKQSKEATVYWKYDRYEEKRYAKENHDQICILFSLYSFFLALHCVNWGLDFSCIASLCYATIVGSMNCFHFPSPILQ